MREKGYLTLLDPLQQKYGGAIGGILFLPTVVSDIVWLAAILSALGTTKPWNGRTNTKCFLKCQTGTTLSVILGIDSFITVISSATVILIYTFLGGMYSVAFTDVIQLICIVFGLVSLCSQFNLKFTDFGSYVVWDVYHITRGVVHSTKSSYTPQKNPKKIQEIQGFFLRI